MSRRRRRQNKKGRQPGEKAKPRQENKPLPGAQSEASSAPKQEKAATPTKTETPAPKAQTKAPSAPATQQENVPPKKDDKLKKPAASPTPSPPKSEVPSANQSLSGFDELDSLEDDDLTTASSSPRAAHVPTQDSDLSKEQPQSEDLASEPSHSLETDRGADEPHTESPAAPDAQSGLGLRSMTSLEKAALILMGLILTSFFILGSLHLKARFGSEGSQGKIELPVIGQHLVVSQLETYWVSPTENSGTSSEVSLVPMVNFTLSNQSKPCRIRILFRDEKNDFAGDPTTLAFDGSSLNANRNRNATLDGMKVQVHATTGFQLPGEMISYRADETFRWQVIILESDSEGEFRELITTSISPQRR